MRGMAFWRSRYRQCFQIFVATAGALEYPRWRFVITVMIARSARYYIEGILAVYFGQRVLRFIADNGMMILSLVGSLCLISLAIYLLSKRGRRAVENAMETKDIEG
jgi:membrane protein DedA with SNARE-associated domain